jgi:DNA-binding beta-propeller fold protein YncE
MSYGLPIQNSVNVLGQLIIFLILVLPVAGQPKEQSLLPTGVHLDPVGAKINAGNMPLAMILSPDGAHLIVSLGGWREQGIQVIDLASQQVTQTLKQDGAFFGLAFSADGRTLYASGGNEDAIYSYDWNGKSATLRGRLELAKKDPTKMGTRYPAGLASSRNGKFLYVAENIGDALAVVDLSNQTVVQRLPTEHYPYAVAVAANGSVYVSAWGGRSVLVFNSQPNGMLRYSGRIGVGRHPSAILLDEQNARLFVALASLDQVVMVDTRTRKVVRRFNDAAPGAPEEGSTPNALALSADRSRLLVAEADTNAVAVFDVTSRRKNRSSAGVSPVGRIPTDWYPTAILHRAGQLLVLSGKGEGSRANPDGPTPGQGHLFRSSPRC